MSAAAYLKNKDSWFYDALFVVLLITVIIFKFSDLSLPYFWDELGVYSRAVVYQYDHGVSLLPSSLTVELSRGHPLLFTYLNSLAMKIAGSKDVSVVHTFNLLIALILLAVLYFKTARSTNKAAGIVCTALVASQPIFLAQSSLVLPEVLLTLFTILALFSYYEEDYGLFALWASLAILTKESAVIIPFVVILYSILRRIFSAEYKLKPVQFLSATIPYAVLGVFLLIQKKQYGWYFFPYHLSLIVQSPAEFWQHLVKCCKFIFVQQGRFLLLYVLITFAAYLLYKRKNAQGSLLLLVLLFVVASLVFNALNFYMNRYLITTIIPLSIVCAVGIVSIGNGRLYVSAITTIALCLTSLYFLTDGNFNYDVDMGYRSQVKTTQKGVDYLCEVSGDKMVYANFPGHYAIHWADGGYLKNRQLNSRKYMNDSVQYVMLSQPSSPWGHELDSFDMTLLREFKEDFTTVQVFSVMKK